MRILILILASLLLLLIQNAVLIPLRLFPVNLILVFIVAAVMYSDFDTALITSLIGGALLDLVSGVPDGVITLSMVAIFLSAYFVLNNLVSRESNYIILFSTVVGASLVYWAIQSIILGSIDPTGLAWFLALNLLFTYPVFKFYIWIHSKLKIRVYEN